jgi:hypothetical protein
MSDKHHLVSHILKPHVRNHSVLHVVGVISNPVRYHSRYRLARKWIEEMAVTKNVELHIVETAYGDREHELKELCDSLGVNFLPLRTKSEIWIKENMINLGVRHLLPRDWRYMAWVDADVFFRDPSWALDTVHQLQHYPVIQPWSDCVDLGPNGEIMRHFKSFGSQHQRRVPKQMHPSQPYEYAHTGFAWACTRAFWENVGGMPDFCILGSADHHAAFACIGEVRNTIHRKMTEAFFRKLCEWQVRAIRITHKEVGYIPGRIEHSFHGSKKRRFYRERWEILCQHQYDPDKDIRYDEQGLLLLEGKPSLEHEIHRYNVSRREDSVDQD